MKKFIIAFWTLISLQSFAQQQITTTTKIFTFDLSNNSNYVKDLNNKLAQAISQTILYSVNGVEHIVTMPSDTLQNAPLHFINKNGAWTFESFYPEVKMDGARNYSFVDSLGTFAYSNTGTEAKNPWPFGELVVVRTQGDKLKWTKAGDKKSFYHSVGTGDLNGDGLFDLVGIHMGTYSNWSDDPHIYTQNQDSTFTESPNFLNTSSYKGGSNGLGSTFVGKLFGNVRPEIILGEYGMNSSFGSINTRRGFGIFSFDNQTGQYKYAGSPANLGVFSNSNQGATSIQAADFNNDGKTDLAIATEGQLPSGKGGGYIQIWLNNGLNSFEPGQSIQMNADDSLSFREFQVADIDNDGWNDILLHANGSIAFRGYLSNNKGYYFKLNNLIWKNNHGTFNFLKDSLNISYPKNESLIGSSNFLKGFKVNGKLKFIGFGTTCTNFAGNTCFFNASLGDKTFNLYEITVNFCNNLIKPTFNTPKFSFCSGDSLKLSITNVNKGDSLKWYYGTKSDLNNVSNKTFTDSTKLFVTRTDSLGCVISSDTVNLVKYPIPSAPTLSRDTANNLVASINGITWYKDGTAISDTIQKFKPTTGGSYTAKTTQNGCTSVLSAAYYYLVTDIINLSKDEYIKLAPNPFINQLNFDFVVKGYQRLNIEVYDIATGTKVASQPNLTAGSRITLAQLSGGTYIIRVTSNDQKIVQQFKVVKM